MGRGKRSFNWKARQDVETITDNGFSKKIKLDVEVTGKYDEANALVLPSAKRKTVIRKKGTQPAKILSKKQRKRLEQIVNRKNRKENRANLLERLSKVQASPDLLSRLTSISSLQTKGVRKIREYEEKWDKSPSVGKLGKIKSVGGIIKTKLIPDLSVDRDDVLGFESSSEDSESENEMCPIIEAEMCSAEKCSESDSLMNGRKEEISYEISSESNSIEELSENNGISNENCLVLNKNCSNCDKDHLKSDENSLKSDENGLNLDVEGSKLDNCLKSDDNCSKYDANSFKSDEKCSNSDEKDVELNGNYFNCNEKSSKLDGACLKSDENFTESNGSVEESVENVNIKEASNKSPSDKKTLKRKPKIYVEVNREVEIQRERAKLPIIGEEQVIMEAISENDVVVIAGETGSGKTTQVPQFLYEGGYTSEGKIIGVTEPRRVAAISMSKRVGEELNLSQEEVSYLIRFEGNAGGRTKIKFMTDGVLLKEMQKDFLLKNYSVIILDEAHERSVHTDILIGFLSRIVPLRRKRNSPLKLVIMSATLRLDDFTKNQKLFPTPPPVINVESRQYPVSIHFNKTTPDDYFEEVFRKVCKIHDTLPEGGILVFLTGQKEVNAMVRKLRATFPFREGKRRENVSDAKEEEKSEVESDEEFPSFSRRIRRKNRDKRPILPEVDLDAYDVEPEDVDDGGLSDDDDGEVFPAVGSSQPMWVLPLYSMLPSWQQVKVFEPPPPGCRFCVISTNVAETSLTIPNVKYVVDCGKTKARFYDKFTGISSFQVVWGSKASADQRAGRAGRICPGHCYRLYSSAVFNDQFQRWNEPEMLRKPVDDLLLQLKCMHIAKPGNFPFPTPPDRAQLDAAERRLVLLGALAKPKVTRPSQEAIAIITPLGKAMAEFPLAPRFAKMICLCIQHPDLYPYVVAMVAALSVQEFLLNADEKRTKIWRSWVGTGESLLIGDAMLFLRALCSAECVGGRGGDVEEFCAKTGLRCKAVVEARKIRCQLTNELNARANLNLCVDPNLKPPTSAQMTLLRQFIMSSMADSVAFKISPEELKERGIRHKKGVYRTNETEDAMFLHSSCILRKMRPDWIVYQEAFEQNGAYYLRGVTAIESEWLPLYAPALCNISAPLKYPPPYYDAESDLVSCYANATFGKSGFLLPLTGMEYPEEEDRYKWFAAFILNGEVCEKLKKFSPHLLAPSTSFFTNWAKYVLPQTERMLSELRAKKADKLKTLKIIWEKEPDYLLNTYLEWIPKSMHDKVKSLWPPL